MKHFCLIFYLFMFVQSSQKKPVTLNVHARIDMLKRLLQEQITTQKNSELILPIDTERDYVYVDDGQNPITPIMDFDQRKKDDKFKLKEIVTSSTTKDPVRNVPVERSVDVFLKKKMEKERVVKSKRKPRLRMPPLDTFYRRAPHPDAPLEWVHCQDLITPFFAGYKQDISVTKRLTHNDHSVMRFIQLIRLNTTGHTKEEIYSILYQISNIQLRLFQWDVSAINLLLAALVKGRSHNFRSLNYGIKELLTSWHLDIANTTNLLKQARIFRPPCVKVSEYEGFTKTSSGIRYTKSTKARSTCSLPSGDGCE